MESNKKRDFVTYVNNAKDLLAKESIPFYENYIENIQQFNPLLDQMDQVFYIIDFSKNKMVYCSPNSLEVEGYSSDAILKMGPLGFMDLFHEKDYEIIVSKVFVEGLAVTKEISNYDLKKLKIAYNFRLKQPDGSYRMLLNQFSHVSEDEDHNPIIIMGTISDISEIHTKMELFCRVMYQNAKGKWNKIFERFYSLADEAVDYQLTPKEFEIIQFVHKGLSSKEIAKVTNRSEETIKSQRKSILAKTACQSMTDVIVLAHKNNWI